MLYLNASNIAAAVGMNPYHTREDLLDSLISVPIVQIDSPAVVALKDASIKYAKEAAQDNSEKTIAEYISITVSESIKADLPIPVINDLVTTMSTTYGIEREAQSIEDVVASANTDVSKVEVVESNQKMYYKTFCIGPHKYRIGGKVDALLSNGELIEIKNRINRFMTPIPARDRVQLHIYMILTNTYHGTLSEHLRVNNKVEIKNTEIPFDPEFWNLISGRLDKFAMDYYSRI